MKPTPSLESSPTRDPGKVVPLLAPRSPDATGVRVRRATSRADLEQAAALRYRAHRHHGTAWASQVQHPEAADADPQVHVLLAECKSDGTPLGTVRLHRNHHSPLPLEAFVQLPTRWQGRRLLEAERLAVPPHASLAGAARDALFKACFLHALEHDIQAILVTARPAVARIYEGLLFEDVFEARTMVSMPFAGNLPHRVLGLWLAEAPSRWLARNHPMLGFMLAGLKDLGPGAADARLAA